MVINKHAVIILRWTGTCPSCGAKRSIIKKLGKNQAYCEKCGLGFTNKFLTEYTAKARGNDLIVKLPAQKSGNIQAYLYTKK